MYGILLSTGTPCSLRPSLSRLIPPSSTVPPSGTLTVVVTERMRTLATAPYVGVFALSSSFRSLVLLWSVRLLDSDDFVVEEVEPVKVNVLTVADAAEERHER